MCAERRVANPRNGNAPRVVVLDGLRLLAASMVVFYHYVGVSNAEIGHAGRTDVAAWGRPTSSVFPATMHSIAMYGWTGVELFFMISGFVICMSGWGRRPADFFVSRVVRLVPGYWAAIALTTLVLVVFPRLSSGVRPSVVLTNLTMVQSAYGVQNLVPAFWTLFIELTFYLLFGIVAIGGVTYRRMVTFCVLWSVASIAVAGSHDTALTTLVNAPYSAYFVAGIAFFLIHKFGSNLLLWGIVAYSWLISINTPRGYAPWPLAVVLTSFFVIMGLVATHKLDRIRWRWLPVAGALTYPLYLIHQDIGFTTIAYLRDKVPSIALVVLVYAGMLALAWGIHRAVERPVAPILKRRLSEAVGNVIATGRRTPALAGAAAGSAGAVAGVAGAGAAVAGGAGVGGAEPGGAKPVTGRAGAARPGSAQPGLAGSGMSGSRLLGSALARAVTGRAWPVESAGSTESAEASEPPRSREFVVARNGTNHSNNNGHEPGGPE
jgi:peptidoglycan/LPS O-acetylase OafA/YrhL